MTEQTFQALNEWRIKMENSLNETSRDIALVKQKLDNVCVSMENFHLDNKEQYLRLVSLVEKISDEKANKWVEIAMTRLNWIIISAVVVALLYLVIK